MDVFSFANPDPYRIDFFGDEVESIRTFDVDNHSFRKDLHEKISILPNVQELTLEDVSEPLTDYLDASSVIWISDIRFTTDKLNEIYNDIARRSGIKEDEVLPLSENQLTTGHYLLGKLPEFQGSGIWFPQFLSRQHPVPFNTSPQPAFNKNFNLLAEDLLALSKNEYQNYISERQ